MPTIAKSADLPLADLDDRVLGPPDAYLRGEWANREWRNVPGPFYGAQTDSCWTGRLVAPSHVLYEDDFGSEIVFRQPQDPEAVRLVLSAAWSDPFLSYACDGDEHWTLALVREWWGERKRLTAWIRELDRTWSISDRDDERENAAGLRDYADSRGTTIGMIRCALFGGSGRLTPRDAEYPA